MSNLDIEEFRHSSESGVHKVWVLELRTIQVPEPVSTCARQTGPTVSYRMPEENLYS